MRANRPTESPQWSQTGQDRAQPHKSGTVAIYVVDSGASGCCFDDLIILYVKHRVRDYTSLSTPRTILTAGGTLLEGTAEGVLQGLITNDYEEQQLARIAILIVPGIGRNLFSVKTAARKGNVSIIDVNKLTLEAGDITVPLRRENSDLNS